MTRKFSKAQLEAYLDEALPVDEMAAIEQQLRDDVELGKAITAVNSRRDAGVHTLGEIWRNQRISCPGRDRLGSYLLGAIGDEERAFIEFHLSTFACRYCQANLADLEAQAAKTSSDVDVRRRKYFQSSAGYLKPQD